MSTSAIESVADRNETTTKKWRPTLLTSQNIPAFLQSPYIHTLSQKSIQKKKKKAKEATSVGGTTAIARTLMMQSLYLFYRTPVKVYSHRQHSCIVI